MCGFGSARNAPVTVRSEAPMRKLLGCAVLGALLFTTLPLSVVAQRAAARPAGGSAQRTSFGPELNWSSAVDFGIGASATKAGLNLLGGTTFKLKGSKLTPFVDARGEIGGGKTFIITGGVRF